MKTVSATVKAWIAQHSSVSPADLLKGERIDDLQFSAVDMSRAGWTQVGTATITVQLTDERTMVSNKVNALREEAKNIRAEATAKVTRIEGQINDLLALSFDGVVEA